MSTIYLDYSVLEFFPLVIKFQKKLDQLVKHKPEANLYNWDLYKSIKEKGTRLAVTYLMQ